MGLNDLMGCGNRNPHAFLGNRGKMNRREVAQIVSEIPQGLDADEFLIELAKRAFAFGMPEDNPKKAMCHSCGTLTQHVSGYCQKHRKAWVAGFRYAMYKRLGAGN